MKRVLVTGAAGFIGSHVSEMLLERGDVVVGYDNVNDYYPIEYKRRNIAFLRKHGGFRFVEGSLRTRRCWRPRSAITKLLMSLI